MDFITKKIYDSTPLIIDNDKIFYDIYPDSNYQFSKMNIKDQNEMLDLINNYYLELRETLNLNKDISIGLELEFEHCKYRRIGELLKTIVNDWTLDKDGSLKSGGEIKSPVLHDTPITWINLNKICEIVNENSRIDINSGSHVHIGAHILGPDIRSWLNFLKLWATYENIIYRFTSGEKMNTRPIAFKTYACSMADSFIYNYNDFKNSENKPVYSLMNRIGVNKHQAVNFKNVSYKNDTFCKGNTIELRTPNGTLNPIIWQNNINVFVKMLEYSKSDNYNNDIISNRLLKININDYKNYYKLYLNQALELTDLIFDNNLDKIYFLRQYLKSFQSSKDPRKKAKQFTK